MDWENVFVWDHLETDAYFTNLADQGNVMGSMVQDLAYAIPGVDEAMGFAEVMKWVLELQSRGDSKSPWWLLIWVESRTQTGQVHEIFRHCLWHSSYWPYPSIPFLPYRFGEGSCQN